MSERGGKRGETTKRKLGVKKRGRYILPPNTPSLEGVVIKATSEVIEDEGVLVGQEATTAAGAEADNQPPTHAHTRDVGSVGVRDIGCHNARMWFA